MSARHHVRAALGDVGGALRHAGLVDYAALTTVERRARYWTTLARVHDLAERPERVRYALSRVYAVAPQEVTGRPRVRQLARKVGFRA